MCKQKMAAIRVTEALKIAMKGKGRGRVGLGR